MVMAGQISSAEVDHQDTFFFENYRWKVEIEEDEKPDYFLYHEYPDFA
jgi:D-lyxose ketol-isomerase